MTIAPSSTWRTRPCTVRGGPKIGDTNPPPLGTVNSFRTTARTRASTGMFTGPSYRRVDADNTIHVKVLNPGPQRELHTPADLDAVLSGMKKGDVVTFLVYLVPRGEDDKGTTQALSLEVGG